MRTGTLTGACSLYRCLLTQLGMLQDKLDVIMMTTILFSISNININCQIIIFTKTPIYEPHCASALAHVGSVDFWFEKIASRLMPKS